MEFPNIIRFCYYCATYCLLPVGSCWAGGLHRASAVGGTRNPWAWSGAMLWAWAHVQENTCIFFIYKCVCITIHNYIYIYIYMCVCQCPMNSDLGFAWWQVRPNPTVCLKQKQPKTKQLCFLQQVGTWCKIDNIK